MTQDRPWSIPVRVEDVPEDGRDFAYTADESVRASVARAAGVVAMPEFQAAFNLRPHGRGGLHLTGSVSARVEQTCVVTLEPLTSSVAESIDIIYAPGADAPQSEDDASHEPGQPEPPEALVEGMIDLGAIAVEFLLLGIDPYPRKAGAVFSPPQSGGEKESPFAALAALKKGPTGGD